MYTPQSKFRAEQSAVSRVAVVCWKQWRRGELPDRCDPVHILRDTSAIAYPGCGDCSRVRWNLGSWAAQDGVDTGLYLLSVLCLLVLPKRSTLRPSVAR